MSIWGFGCEPQALFLTKLRDLSDHGGISHMVHVDSWRSPGRGWWWRGRLPQRGHTPWGLGPGPALLAAAPGSLSLVAIKTRVVTCGDKGLAIIWIAKVPVPDAVNDPKHLCLVPSVGGVSLLVTTLGGPATTTTATTALSAAASASLVRANARDSDNLLKTRIIADAVQEEGGGLREVVLRGNIILDDSKGALSSLPLIPCKK